MRSASRVFHGIALFAVVAALLFAVGSGFDNVQGIAILGTFAAACLYLGYLLGKQARFDLGEFAGSDAGGDEEPGEIHLPGPSWYPALYGVAGAVVVLGLVFSYAVLWVGVVLLVLTTIGWARESVAEYRREVAHSKPQRTDLPSDAAVDLAHRVAAFRSAHHGAEAVVQHVGRGSGEVVLVGADGRWGNLGVPDVATGREACRLAGVPVHEHWPAGLGSRIRPDHDLWLRMGSSNPFDAPRERAPRDGTTQVGARVFAWIGGFAVVAATLFYLPQRDWDSVQGTAILLAFAAANFYLFVALRNAKARPEDAAFVDGDYVTREPEQAPRLDPETLHLPGPSWWPAVFSVAGGALVIGLVTSYAVLWAGVALLGLASIGWAVESVREYRAQLAHTGHAGLHGGGAAADPHH